MHTANASGFKVYWLSERAVTLEFGHEIGETLLNQITAFNTNVISNPFPGFITSVPAYTTLTVFYDPVAVSKAESLMGGDCFEKVSNYLYTLQQPDQLSASNRHYQPSTITIPTIYNGPDISNVARINNLSVEEVIQLHSSATYKVYMIGFVPGFAYLGGMSALIAAPRRATPRKTVPIGCVGIAGNQTGIYPIETPGGWQLIGQTPLTLFDANREQPSLLQTGDEVVFTQIGPEEFEYIANSKYADSHY